MWVVHLFDIVDVTYFYIKNKFDLETKTKRTYSF